MTTRIALGPRGKIDWLPVSGNAERTGLGLEPMDHPTLLLLVKIWSGLSL